MEFLSYIITFFTFLLCSGSCFLNIYLTLFLIFLTSGGSRIIFSNNLKDFWLFLKSICLMVFRKGHILIAFFPFEFFSASYCLSHLKCSFVELYL